MKKIFPVLMICMAVFCLGIASAQGEEANKLLLPKKAEVDSNFDGIIDRTEYYDAGGKIAKIESDANGDGIIDERIFYKDGLPMKGERDSNGDGKPDIWIEY